MYISIYFCSHLRPATVRMFVIASTASLADFSKAALSILKVFVSKVDLKLNFTENHLSDPMIILCSMITATIVKGINKEQTSPSFQL